MSMLACLCDGIVLFWVIVVCDVGVCKFDSVMLLSAWKTFLLLSLWLRLFADFVQFCVCSCFILVLFCSLSDRTVQTVSSALGKGGECFMLSRVSMRLSLYLWCEIRVVKLTFASWNVFIASSGYY